LNIQIFHGITATDFMQGGEILFQLLPELISEQENWSTFAMVIVKIKTAPFVWPHVRIDSYVLTCTY